MLIYPVFHVSLLEIAPRNAKLKKEAIATYDTTDEYEVEEIKAKKIDKNEYYYLIK